MCVYDARALASRGRGQVPVDALPLRPCDPPAQAMPLLLARQRGIREVNIVGDSNMRVLAQHLHHLFLAGYDNPEQGTLQYNLHPKWGAFSMRVPLSHAETTSSNWHRAWHRGEQQQWCATWGPGEAEQEWAPLLGGGGRGTGGCGG